MNVYKIPVRGYFEVNSYFLIDEDTGHGFLIDPGAEGDALASIINSRVWTIEKVLLTHGHFDHTGGIEALQRQLGLPVYIHENGAAYRCPPIQNVRVHFSTSKASSLLIPLFSTISA